MHLGVTSASPRRGEFGIAGIGVIRAGHIGRPRDHAEKATAAGVVSSDGTSRVQRRSRGAVRRRGSGPPPSIRGRWGCYYASHPPFIMDFATTAVAAGKVAAGRRTRQADPGRMGRRQRGVACHARLANTWEGAATLPFAGHKGFALPPPSIQLVAGALTGAGVTQRPQVVPTGGLGFAGNATFFLVLDISHFTDVDQFFADVDGLFERLDGVKPAAGFQRGIVPGEPEARAAPHTSQGRHQLSRVWSGSRSHASQPNRRSTWTTFRRKENYHE